MTTTITNSEKRLLKEFLDGFDSTKLCDIVRSVFHGGGVVVYTREGTNILNIVINCIYKF